MALIPKISVSFSGKCNKVTLVENTKPYETSNLGGWGAPNDDTAHITAAAVKFYPTTTPPTTTPVSTYIFKDASIDVYASALGAPTPGSFTAYNEALWENPDGVYTVIYTVEALGVTYKNKSQEVLFLCNLCACKEALVMKLIKACDSEAVTKLKQQVDQMEVFMYGIKSAFSCKDYTTVASLLEAASAYCQTISDCGCGCGGC